MSRLEETIRALTRESVTVELLLSVASTANQAKSLREALASGLEILCNYLDFHVGHACLVQEPGSLLSSSGLWYGDEARSLRALRIDDAALGLTGAALSAQRPVVAKAGSNHPAAQSIVEDFCVGLAFPIFVEATIVAVIELYARRSCEIDGPTLAVLQLTADQLGLVAQRERRELELRSALHAAERELIRRSELTGGG
ncbi:MAG: GAF domain-containing protein [Myxococcota bacterium]